MVFFFFEGGVVFSDWFYLRVLVSLFLWGGLRVFDGFSRGAKIFYRLVFWGRFFYLIFHFYSILLTTI